jgi:hypothetical protein
MQEPSKHVVNVVHDFSSDLPCVVYIASFLLNCTATKMVKEVSQGCISLGLILTIKSDNLCQGYFWEANKAHTPQQVA